MNQSLQELSSRTSADPQSALSDLNDYFLTLADNLPSYSSNWAADILAYGEKINAVGSQDLKLAILEQGWNPVFTRLINDFDIQNEWFHIQMKIIREIKYTPGVLFYRRAEQLSKKTLFTFKRGRDWQDRSWSAVRNKVDQLAAGILELGAGEPSRIAVFSENRIEVAYTDIACLSHGFVNVPIQPASPPAQLEYILKHAEVNMIFLSDAQHLRTLESILHELPELKHIITYNDIATHNPHVISYKRLLKAGAASDNLNWLEGMRLSVNLDTIATIMYTSGTTGYPKGITFTYENIISKRFARSLALNLGPDDSFLSFLPLFHTFGRYLEMWGAIFWGARYTFSSGKGIQSLLADMQDIEPTVLISIPKRWQDIYDKIATEVDIEHDEIDVIHPLLEKLTGGKLQWGLSAAGYLPPEVFRFFQMHGIHLHSGYGMTEATGGITMTPTGQYIENSVGVPLPGMELKLADDSELWIKGVYVSAAYWRPEEPEVRPDGWFTTGDIFQAISNGQYEIIDRKKEIYKNAKGQTIAPQKIENMFREFDSIHQLFIVGDHQPYNTALVHVNDESEEIQALEGDEQAVRDYVASMINSVNSFLAPFERIVDFHLVERAFDTDHGELTEKASFKRSVIMSNFDSHITELYEKPYKSFLVEELEVRIPNWIFLQRGWTQNDLEVRGNALHHRNSELSLTIKMRGEDIQIGSLNYQFDENILEFDTFIRQPAYCIGNHELESFLGYADLRIKPLNQIPEWLPGYWIDIEFTEDELSLRHEQVQQALDSDDSTVEALRPVIDLIYSQTLDIRQQAYRLMVKIYADSDEKTRNVIRYAFLRLIRSDDLGQSQFAVEQVVALLPAPELERIVAYALSRKLLFPMSYTNSAWTNINTRKIELATEYLKWLTNSHDQNEKPSVSIQNILGILHSWANQFPEFYSKIRSGLISAIVHFDDAVPMKQLVMDYYDSLIHSFSRNVTQFEPINTNPFEEPLMKWEDVLAFDKSISSAHRNRITDAFVRTSFFSESMFLFFNGLKISLQDLPPEGIWITPLREGSGKVVYRTTVQSQDRSYKFVINLAEAIKADQLKMELHWLLACARDDRLDQIVETFGSYQHKYELWSEEYIPGLTVKHYLEKAVQDGSSDESPPPDYVWPHLLWTGILTYTNFWKRTRFKKCICHPIPAKIIVPIHDYYVGGRLVSITGICDETNELSFLENLEQSFAAETVTAFPQFDLKVDHNIIYHAIHESLGDKHSDDFFQAVLEDPATTPERKESINHFLQDAKEHGYQTKSVYFATRRYHRWLTLNPDATLDAKAHTVKELYRDYRIQEKEADYPDARVQLFMWTIFSESDDALQSYLSTLARDMREESLNTSTLQGEVSNYISENDLGEFEEFFLKRLAFPQLTPTEDIELIATKSTTLDEVEMMISRHDKHGKIYRIRRAMHPREIIQLQRLFFKANMDVGFSQDHQFLVVLNEKERVIGGLFYKYLPDESVLMDKMVISEPRRNSNISRGLLEEFINRMQNEQKQMIITGFLHPGYFYKFGFVTEKDQGGLVKYL